MSDFTYINTTRRYTLSRSKRILIVGLGNELLRDDGVGIHAVRAIRSEKIPGVRVAEVGTAVLDALDIIEWADIILGIDAMEAGGPPGTVYRFGLDDVAEAGITNSLHEVNIQAALRFLPGHTHPKIVMLGVEPQSIEYDLELSPAVTESLPTVVNAVRETVERWQAEGKRARNRPSGATPKALAQV